MRALNTINLAEKERSSILKAADSFRSRLPVSRVVLFGSKARGSSDVFSDIDLLVLTSCPVTSTLRDSISDTLAEINLQNDVLLSSVVVCEQDWTDGLIRYMPIYNEIQRDGCEI